MVSISKKLIDEMVETVVSEVKPLRIYLFGSCALGTEGTDSDIDLLIIEEDAFNRNHNRWSELKRIRRALKRFHIPKDILVYSHEEFDQWQHATNHIIGHATRQGRLVYERP